ncbi:MAG: hypothetical protein JOZ96_23090 [Acidobacteria bacterium]|nr:hypothetical protein [Acidobacteriota bacterium]
MSWLREEVDPVVQRQRLAFEKEQAGVLAMRQPLTPEQTYRLFGTFLGLLPPLALFDRFLTESKGEQSFWVVALCVAMNIVCCLVGRWIGGRLGLWAGDPRRRTRVRYAFVVLAMAFAWSFVTGALGGAVFFIIGAFFGVLIATPVALVAFPAFAILHRLISRGGMIDARHAWSLAFGIPLTIAALISSPWIK